VLEEKNIIKVTVQQGVNRPYYMADKGLKPAGVYVRQGSASVPASDNSIRRMIKETDGDAYEQIRASTQDLTFLYAKEKVIRRNLEFGPVQMKTLGLQTADGLYTNLGLLLSEQCIHSIKVACFEGVDKSVFKDRREFAGSLLHQLHEAYAYIDIFNKTNATFVGLLRIDKRDYPPEAIREALLNALVHREYAFSGSTLINIYEDRLEFVSLGGLVPGLSLEDVLLGVSQTRNERLANLFYRLRLIEAYGTGVAKIVSSYRNCTRQPVLKATESAFQVILPNRNIAGSNKSLGVAKPAESYPPNVQHETVMETLAQYGSITRSDVESVLGVGQTRALNVLKSMTDAGYLVAVGKGKNTLYRATKS